MSDYNIIGDIHGQSDKLEELLDQLGYEQVDGVYRNPEKKAVFVGDFIDRGPQQRRVIEIVRPMVENGHAFAVMGNHEFNAICYHTHDPVNEGEYLRPHNEKNRKQHQKFLDEYPLGSSETHSVIDWFKTLPLYLELEAACSMPQYVIEDDEPNRIDGADSIRIIHACWDQDAIDLITQKLTKERQLTDELIIDAAREGTETFNAIETLIKGPEISLPEGVSFRDKDNVERHNIRIKWWGHDLKTYSEAALVPVTEKNTIPDLNLPEDFTHKGYPEDAPPVFFGHYWMSGEPCAQRSNVACLDFSAGGSGPLLSYYWINSKSRLGSGKLRGDHFCFVNHDVEEVYPEDVLKAAGKQSNIF